MILDIITGIAVVIGASLMALGAFGLVRFPDVFTRMHSATKAASVGVIATTIAASLQVVGLGGALLLIIVVALLFLSAPLGMSLLARAAYHDPETPRWPATRELEMELPIPESTTTRTVPGTSRWLAVWLFIVWVALFGSIAPNVIVGGIVVSVGLAWAYRGLAPRWPRALIRPWAAVRFVGHFTAQLIASTWDVIWSLRLPPDEITPAVIEVPLRVRTRSEIALLMNSISFTPGTVALELHDTNLYVHVLDTDDPDRVVDEIRTMEDAIRAAFGADGRPEPQRNP